MRPDDRLDRILHSNRRQTFTTSVELDWATIGPADRLEFLGNPVPSRGDRRKRELLKSLLSYHRFATRETRPEAYRFEIDRINAATVALLSRSFDSPLDHPPSVDAPDVTALEDASSTVEIPMPADDDDSGDTIPPTDVLIAVRQPGRRRGWWRREPTAPSESVESQPPSISTPS